MGILSIISILKTTTIILAFFTIFFLVFAIWTIIIIIKTKVPFAEIPDNNLKIIFEELKLPAGSTIYDLGCGNGKVLFLAEKFGYNAIGYELSPMQYYKCKIKKFLYKSKIKIFRKNFYYENFNDANVIFLFLVGAVMEKVEKLLKKESKPNTIVVSYGFILPSYQPIKIINSLPSKIYFYKT